MDLFGDLPEPERAPRPSAGKEAQGRPVLFEDLPPASSTDSGTVFRLSQALGDLYSLMIFRLLPVAIQVLLPHQVPRW
ncbi:integrin-linked kinase-associated serine/threonine phosphatase 2C, isoform CRA_c [Mus musculus]|nr:integrin-linked kinase-associated serine/threonine phosphatase 2C, isoform CRA_c [Mus musculus]